MKKFVLVLIFTHSVTSLAKQIKVAVIDSGISSGNKDLCDSGHKDFTNPEIARPPKAPLVDNHGHGSNVSDIISQYANGHIRSYIDTAPFPRSDLYCIVNLKFWDPVGSPHSFELIDPIKEAIDLKVDIINISAGGTGFDINEKNIIKKALDKGIIVVAAAGNDGRIYGVPFTDALGTRVYNYYPAAHDKRIVVVGSKNFNGQERASFSNYGKVVNAWEIGIAVAGRYKGDNIYLDGTSQAAAIRTGRIVRGLINERIRQEAQKGATRSKVR